MTFIHVKGLLINSHHNYYQLMVSDFAPKAAFATSFSQPLPNPISLPILMNSDLPINTDLNLNKSTSSNDTNTKHCSRLIEEHR